MDTSRSRNTIHRNVACTRCGCVCDDLEIEVNPSQQVVSISPGCHLAEDFYGTLQNPALSAPAILEGRPSTLIEAAEAAAELLRASRSPLFFGLSRSSTDGQRAACELADLVGGTIDTTASIGHGASILALQAAGESTSTLGEVRHRSDLVIYWANDPMMSHPRHMERFVDAIGLDVPNGRKDRHVVIVDTERRLSAERADTFLQITPGSDFEVLWALRALVRGLPLTSDVIGGIRVEQLQELADRMKASRYGAVFFGVQLTEGAAGHTNVEALLRLVTDLNEFTRFVARRMRVPGDVTGADSVLCWQTGYPFSVSLTRGYPRYNPGEFSAGPMLARGDTDCVVLIGAERVRRLGTAAVERLGNLPVILLDPPNFEWDVKATVRFNTAIDGIHRRGTVYRMDEVPVPLRQVASSELPSDEDVLRQILSQFRKAQ